MAKGKTKAKPEKEEAVAAEGSIDHNVTATDVAENPGEDLVEGEEISIPAEAIVEETAEIDSTDETPIEEEAKGVEEGEEDDDNKLVPVALDKSSNLQEEEKGRGKYVSFELKGKKYYAPVEHCEYNLFENTIKVPKFLIKEWGIVK